MKANALPQLFTDILGQVESPAAEARIRFPSVLATLACIAAALLPLNSALFAQGNDEPVFHPVMNRYLGGVDGDRGDSGVQSASRVAGLSIVITNDQEIAGTRQVDFDVQLTTERTNLTSTTISASFSNVSYRTFLNRWTAERGVYVFQLSNVSSSLNRPQLGQLDQQAQISGSLNISQNGTHVTDDRPIAMSSRGVADGTAASFVGYRGSVQGNINFSSQANFATTGLLPAVDFGDGSTVPVTSLSTTVSSTVIPTTNRGVGGLGVRRTVYRRAGLSHLYGDLSPYTIRVASGCCADDEPDAVTGSVLHTGSNVRNTQRSTNGVDTPIAGDFVFNSNSVQTFSNTVSEAPLGDESSGTETSTETFNTTVTAAVLTATASVGGILAIPTANSVGLAVLALVLAFLGVFLVAKR